MGIVIQLSSLMLMFVQSIILPYLIGLESYGKAVVYVLPLFFSVAILETFYAKMMDSGYGNSIFGISLIFILLTILINFYFLDVGKISAFLFLLVFFYIFSLAFKGILYHKQNYVAIAYAEVISVIIYFFSVIFTYGFLVLEGIYVYICSLLSYAVTNFLVSYYFIKKINFNCWDFNLDFIKFLLIDIVVSIFWKSYHIYINIFLLFVVSFFYPDSFVASLKIIFSISYSVRFIAPFTLPMFFNFVKENYLLSLRKIIKVQIYSILLSFLSFYAGRFLCSQFNILNSFIVFFEDIKIFLSYPMVVFSVYFGAFFIILNKIFIFFLITSLSFIFMVVAIYLEAGNFYWIFFLSVIFYQISILFCMHSLYKGSRNKLKFNVH